MATHRVRLRDGTEADLPALARLDSSFSNEWLLYLQRRGGPVEQTIELRWRKVRPAGSRRELLAEAAAADLKGVVEELRRDMKRSQRTIVAEAEGRIVGFIMLGEQWNRTVEINAIIIDRAHRRRALGRRFVQEAEGFAREHGLRALQWEAQTDNRDAIEFAMAQGFRIAGFHDALYHNRGYERQLAPDFRGLAVFLTKELP